MSIQEWKSMTSKSCNILHRRKTEIVDEQENELRAEVQYLNFSHQDDLYCLYILELIDQIREATTSLQSLAQEFSYDHYAPNAIFYFDKDGATTYKNPLAKALRLKAENMKDIFLEPEIGALPSALHKLQPGKEHIIRMIMKCNGELIEGYARVSIYPEHRDTEFFRLEFLLLDGMSLTDKPLEQAMIEIDRLKREVVVAKEIIIDDAFIDFKFDDIVTQSKKYKAVLRQVAQVADTDSTVLITGETGTGKELLCNILYNLSDRSNEIIVKVNCATIPENLIESILFGHEKGAFTDAKGQRIGKFELAHKGTIFLDEIGEMPYEMQSRLLRVLQEGEIERVGNPKPIKIDVRVIAATNRNLEQMVKEKKFRSDLFYRLNVFPIYNIPLRERKEDISLLIKHFIQEANRKTGRKVNKVLESDVKILEDYDYPGNVRELENIIERSVILSDSDTLNLGFFSVNNIDKNGTNSHFLSLEDMERTHISDALKIAKGRITGQNSAAELLKINGKTLVSRIKKLNINPKQFKA
ncbi:sigma-54 interaction domain-containing protein [Portibacter marinus]|uniref:sigma-54 interaction domain-containing protein n=1 Tax=Portibacter marinus TaxID=2898660 RepID=UPI001F33ABB4|nr:sigma 54-interacting transcriptional regulator [Portibacter marinus]